MDDAIFDTVFALCMTADEAGFSFVADALELVLDVYLMEEAQMNESINVAFKSRRRAEQIAKWNIDAAEDTAHFAEQNALIIGWNMSNFPLLQARQSERRKTSVA